MILCFSLEDRLGGDVINGNKEYRIIRVSFREKKIMSLFLNTWRFLCISGYIDRVFYVVINV